MKMMDRYHWLSQQGKDVLDVAGVVLTHNAHKGMRAKRMKTIHSLVELGWNIKMAEFSFTVLLLWRDGGLATPISFESLDNLN